MKKKLIIILVILLLMTGCSNISLDQTEANKAELEERAREFSKLMRGDSIEDVEFLPYFNSFVQRQLTEDYMKSAVHTYKNITGGFVEETDADSFERDKESVVEIHTNNTLRSAIEYYTLNTTKALNSVYFKYGPIEENETEDYIEYPIELKGEAESIPGALVLPKDLENPPIAILIAGSGPNDMDETIGREGNKPLKDIAAGLAKEGIASLRYDKISLHESPAGAVTAQWEYLTPIKSAVDLINSRDDINSSDIYIIGHSQGAMMAPAIAKEMGNTSGIILMAGSARNLQDVIAFQNKKYFEQDSSLTSEEKEEELEKLNNILQEIDELKTSSNATILGLPVSYWISLKDLNLKEELSSYKGGILILQGGQDFQVDPTEDFNSYKRVLKNNSSVEYRLFDNLNHFFMESDSDKLDMSAYDKKQNVNQEVINTIIEWIKNDV